MELKLAKMNQPYRDNREIIEDYKVLISTVLDAYQTDPIQWNADDILFYGQIFCTDHIPFLYLCLIFSRKHIKGLMVFIS